MVSVLHWPATAVHGICSEEWLLPSETPLQKTAFPFAGVYQWQTASWLGWKPMSISPSRCWQPHLARTLLVFCMLAWTLWVHMHISPAVFESHCFFVVIHSHQLSQSSCLLLHIDPWALKGGALMKVCLCMGLSLVSWCWQYNTLHRIKVLTTIATYT